MMIVPTLCVGMPPRTLRVRSRMWRRCVPKLQRYPRHALGLLNPQPVPFVTRSVTGGIPTRSDGHDQYRDGLVYNDERWSGSDPPIPYNLASSGKSPDNPSASRTNSALASGSLLTTLSPVLRSQRSGSGSA